MSAVSSLSGAKLYHFITAHWTRRAPQSKRLTSHNFFGSGLRRRPIVEPLAAHRGARGAGALPCRPSNRRRLRVIGDQRDPERNALKAPSSKNSSVFFRLVAPARRLVARGREPLLSVAGDTSFSASPASAARLRPALALHILKGSGDIAVYLTVLVMLAWPRKCCRRRVSIPLAANA
jgi:hypothetical protein